MSGQLWLLNVGGLALLCAAYVDVTRPTTVLGWLFVLGGCLSSGASLSLGAGLLCLALAAWITSRGLMAIASSVLWAVTFLLVYVDTRIYGIFRYHFNGLVWNVLTTPGADEAVHLGRHELFAGVFVSVALVLLEGAAFFLLWRWARRRERLSRSLPRLAWPRTAWKLLLVPNMLLVAGLYAYADLTRDPQVMAFARVFPLYPRVTVKRFAERVLGYSMKDRPGVVLPENGILLDYPKRAPTLSADGPRPNVVVVVIDSLRADMLDPVVMPNLSAFAAHARVFRDHLSGGNATRFGVFGLVYGLHGSYWKPVLDEHRSPALVDALLARGYEPRVLTSASMDFPEFRSTAWVRIESAVEDRLPSERPGGRDDGIPLHFEQWLDARADPAAPFFAFLLLDAPHQSYWFPADCTPFTPYADDIDYTRIDSNASPELRAQLFNRYRNAVHYADQTTARILAALEARGLLANTLVAITGDHGEEFFENGFWGHTSNFTRAQAQVPFVLAGPLVAPGEELRPTSHIDLPATILELCGADPALRPEWTLGENLLAPLATRTRVVAGWDTLGLHVSGAILEVSMTGYGSGITARDPSWRPLFDDSDLLQREGKSLANLALECRRFLR